MTDKQTRQSFGFNNDGSIGVFDDSQSNDDNQPVKQTKLSPFDFVNAITYTKENLFPYDHLNHTRLDRPDSEYIKFIINRAISYYSDTILFANAANMWLNNVSNSSHFDFYALSIDRKRRFAKWGKPTINDDVELIAHHYNVNRNVANQFLTLLSKDDIDKLKQQYQHGGKQTR